MVGSSFLARAKYYLRVYGLLCKLHFQARLQFRSDFFIGLVGILVTNIAGFMTIWLVFRTTNSIAGWDVNEIIFMYSFVLLATLPFQLCFENLWQLGDRLVDGSFIKYYFRPLNLLFYYIAETLDIKSVGQLAIGVFAMFYVTQALSLDWDLYFTLKFVLLYLSASLTLIAIMLMLSGIGFWTGHSTFAMLIGFKLKDFSQYPIDIYNGLMKFVLSVMIPVGFVSFYPASALLHESERAIYLLITPCVSVVFFILSYKFWMLGAKRYSGTGS